jgi:predicted nuclease with TOPRIM domain
VCSYVPVGIQTYRVLQGYIDLEFISHPEIGEVIVEHLIKTRTPTNMHSSLKSENVELRSQIKALTSNYEKLESRVGRHENGIKKLKDKK